MTFPISRLLLTGVLFFGAFSASSNYDLNSYSLGGGATNSGASSNYRAQADIGEGPITNNATSSTKAGSGGGVQTEQLSVPLAPTLSNGSNTYYNQLQFILNDTAGSSNYPADTTFAVAVSSNNFTTTNYVQTGGTLGSSPLYQTYSAWGGSGGSFIVGLTPSTTYEVKVAAMQGQFTNTAFGAYASATTVSPSITFSVSPSSISMGNILPGSVTTSSNVTCSLSTDAASGGNIFVSGQHSGLFSTTQSFTIAALTGNLSTSTDGFGLQGQSTSQTSGGPLAIDSPYNGTGNTVGTESSTYTPIFTTTAAVNGGTATVNMQAKSSATDPSATDYQETLTFVAAGSF